MPLTVYCHNRQTYFFTEFTLSVQGLLQVHPVGVPEKKMGDQTGMNKVSLGCNLRGQEITSKTGPWGSESYRGGGKCPRNIAHTRNIARAGGKINRMHAGTVNGVPTVPWHTIIGVAIRTKGDNDDDNEGATGMKFKCSDGTIFQTAEDKGTGEWSDFSMCDYGSVIGLRTRVQSPVTIPPGGDNTAINNVAVRCGYW
jgi:hypothetical protein